MRLIIGLLFISLGLASLCKDHQIQWPRDENVITLSQAEDAEGLHNSLQRRNPGRNKGKKAASVTNNVAAPPTPDPPKSRKTTTQGAKTKKQLNPVTEAIDPSNKATSSKRQELQSKGKSKDRGRSVERLVDTKPSAPPMPDSMLADPSDRQRSPSPPFMWSEPGIRGDGDRHDQGGARTPSDRSPSPVRSLSPDRLPSPPLRTPLSVRLQSLTRSPPSPRLSSSAIGGSSSSVRSKSSLGPPPSPSAPLKERLDYYASLPSLPRSRSPSGSRSSHDTTSSSEGEQSSSRGHLPFTFQNMPPPNPDKFNKWIVAMSAFTDELKSMRPTRKPGNPNEVITVREARETARLKRARADQSRIVAAALSRGQPATSDVVVEAMKTSAKDSADAVKAMKGQTAAQTAASFALKGTRKHQNAIDYWKSSARQWMRAQSRDAHRHAFATEHDARATREVAEAIPSDNPYRGQAFMRAAEHKKAAVGAAQHYYRRRKQYEHAREVFSGEDSSSDQEWPLRDTRPPTR